MVFVPLLVPAALGLAASACILAQSRLPLKPLFHAAVALPMGLGLCSLVLFWSYVTAPQAAGRATLAVCLALTAGLTAGALRWVWFVPSALTVRGCLAEVRERMKSWDAKSAVLTAVAGCYLAWTYAAFLESFASAASWNAFGGWDARYFWNVKAHFYVKDPGAWKSMFSPLLTWTHQDYPLLLPGAVAWGWNWAGRELIGWPSVVALAFMTSLCLLVLWYLAAHTRAWFACLATSYLLNVHMYRFWSTTQYADVPLCFYMTASAVALICALRSREARLFFLSGLFAGLAAWTKNEGVFFVGWAILMACLALARTPGRDRLRLGTFFLSACAIPFSAVWFLKSFLFTGGDYWGSGRTLAEYWALASDPDRTRLIAASFAAFKTSFEQWQGLWWLVAAAVLLGSVDRKRLAEYRWVALALAALVELGYAAILHVTPYDLRFQIETALLRLMLHAGALAFLFAAEVFAAPSGASEPAPRAPEVLRA